MKKLLGSENKIKSIYFKLKSVDVADAIIEGVFSAEVEDRQGEIVVQSGWLLENYLKNPVVLWAHDSSKAPVAKMLEIAVNTNTNQLEGKMQFAVKESEFSKEIFNLMVGGYLKAFSAGFINNRYEIDQENDKVYLIENELLEVSVVPVPANQLALAKSKGVNVSAYEKAVEPSQEELDRIAAEEESGDEDDADESKALEMISKSNVETIRAAIGTLTEVLKAHGADNEVSKVETPVAMQDGKNKVSVKLLNKAIKELLGVKKTYK